MVMQIEDLEDGIKRVSLEGRLDVEGERAVSQQFAFATTTRAERLVIDLAQVTFLASIGIRALLTAARAQQMRGGRVVLLDPAPLVRKVLETAGVDRIVPIVTDLDGARAALVA